MPENVNDKMLFLIPLLPVISPNQALQKVCFGLQLQGPAVLSVKSEHMEGNIHLTESSYPTHILFASLSLYYLPLEVNIYVLGNMLAG